MKALSRHLNLIFWGIVFILIDISFSETRNGEGYRIDIINDLVGAFMVFRGFDRIAKSNLFYQRERLLRGIYYATGLQMLLSATTFFVIQKPEWLSLLEGFVNLYIVWGLIEFAYAMHILSNNIFLPKSRDRWKVSQRLLYRIYFIPMFVLEVLAVISHLVNVPELRLRYDFGSEIVNLALAITLFAMVFVPLIHSLWSIYMMRKEIRFIHGDS